MEVCLDYDVLFAQHLQIQSVAHIQTMSAGFGLSVTLM